MTLTPTSEADRLTPLDEDRADRCFFLLSFLRDDLVHRNERVAAEHVESAILALQDACQSLLRRAA